MHYYGTMGMHLLGQEYQENKDFRTNTARYIAETQRELLPWQQPDGGWPNKGWIKDRETTETNAYATAFATMTLFVPERRLSIYNRTPPKALAIVLLFDRDACSTAQLMPSAALRHPSNLTSIAPDSLPIFRSADPRSSKREVHEINRAARSPRGAPAGNRPPPTAEPARHPPIPEDLSFPKDHSGVN